MYRARINNLPLIDRKRFTNKDTTCIMCGAEYGNPAPLLAAIGPAQVTQQGRASCRTGHPPTTTTTAYGWGRRRPCCDNSSSPTHTNTRTPHTKGGHNGKRIENNYNSLTTIKTWTENHVAWRGVCFGEGAARRGYRSKYRTGNINSGRKFYFLSITWICLLFGTFK